MYPDDSKSPPPKKGAKRTIDRLISKLVDRLKGDKAAYWFNEFLRHNMGLPDSCRESAMNCFDETPRINMEESTWCLDTLEVNNKWLNKGGDYHDNAVRQFKDLGLDIDDCLDGLVIKGIDKVKKLEKEEMVKAVMVTEGVRTKKTRPLAWTKPQYVQV